MASSLPQESTDQAVRAGRPRIAAREKTHDAAFYDHDDQLVGAVLDYLSEGLKAAQPAVVIATGPHRRAFVAALNTNGFDVERLTADGDLLLLDARSTLAAFLDGATPVWDLFQATVGNVLERIRRRRPGAVIRAYGEMVDLLCRDGNATGVVTVEGFWKRMTREYAMSLLCAYSDGSTLRSANGETFGRICREHDAASDLSLSQD